LDNRLSFGIMQKGPCETFLVRNIEVG